MDATLFPYQVEGAEWLASKRYALLADEMGLGKSAQAIVAADATGAENILVLCPAVARFNWMREWQRFSSRTLPIAVLLRGADAKRTPGAGVTICSYDLASRAAIMSCLSRTPWNVCVLDEAHYLKNRKAARTRAALHLGGRAGRVWFLTGTPAPNHPAEIWSLLRACGATELDYWSFVRRYCETRDTPFGIQIVGGRRIDELRRVIAPVVLRRRKEQVMKDLPPILFSDIVVEPSEVPRHKWEQHFDNYLLRPQQFGPDMAQQNKVLDTLAYDLGMGADSLKILEGLDQKVKSLRRWIGLQKVGAVIELVKGELEANAYEKIVLFGVHKSVLQELHEGLRGFGAVLIYGGTPPDKRDLLVRRFQSDKKCRVFVGQVVAAGTAISLTAAHQVMFVEMSWTPAENQQAAMRCHRIGQSKPVTVRVAGMAGSIDEKIQKVLRNKTRVLTQLFDDPFAE